MAALTKQSINQSIFPRKAGQKQCCSCLEKLYKIKLSQPQTCHGWYQFMIYLFRNYISRLLWSDLWSAKAALTQCVHTCTVCICFCLFYPTNVVNKDFSTFNHQVGYTAAPVADSPCDLYTVVESCRGSRLATSRRLTTPHRPRRLDRLDRSGRNPSLGDRASDCAVCCTETLTIHRCTTVISLSNKVSCRLSANEMSQVCCGSVAAMAHEAVDVWRVTDVLRQ